MPGETFSTWSHREQSCPEIPSVEYCLAPFEQEFAALLDQIAALQYKLRITRRLLILSSAKI